MRLMPVALSYGFKYGAQLPGTIYPELGPLYFADHDWKNPNRAVYMQAIKQHRPNLATVLDWQYSNQLHDVLEWAEEMAPYVDTIVVPLKVSDEVDKLPHVVGGKRTRLGYSVKTNYGETDVPLREFKGWDVHLLGGSPHSQMKYRQYLNVKSADQNMIGKMSHMCKVWVPGTAKGRNRLWGALRDLAGYQQGRDSNLEAFRRSCKNYMAVWKGYVCGG